jgi:hypothetical protein
MGIPRHLISVAEKFEACKFWKVVRIPDRRGWVNRYGLAECTRMVWCQYNTTDSRLGGCIICGNVAKILEAERP